VLEGYEERRGEGAEERQLEEARRAEEHKKWFLEKREES